MAETDVGGDMTLKKKMTRMEFRKRADDILVRLTMEVEPFWQDSDDKQTQRLKRAAADPLYFCRTYLPHYFSHLPAPFHYELVKLLEARPAQVTGRMPVPPTEDAGATQDVAPAVVVPAVVAAPREFAKTTVCAFGYVLHQICFKRRNFIIIGSDSRGPGQRLNRLSLPGDAVQRAAAPGFRRAGQGQPGGGRLRYRQ